MTSKSSKGPEGLASVSFLPWVDGNVSNAGSAGEDDGAGSPSTADDDAEFDRVDRLVVQGLRRRGLSVWEVTEILRKNDIPESDFTDWTERYQCLGYLDDAALAEQLVATHHGRKGLGKAAVSQELKRRHIDSETIEQALAHIDAKDELELATAIAVKRAGQLAGYDKETASRRLNAFMMRKGYSSGVVRRAVDVALATRTTMGGRGGSGSGVRFR